MRRPLIAAALRPLAAAVALACAMQAHAGLFDDKEARDGIAKTQKDIVDLRSESNARFERLEAALKMQVELANQIETLRADIAKLRGQMEVLQYESETGQKRQRDFYVDLDGRLRKAESAVGELQVKAAAEPAKPKAVDPANETRAYETALELFKQGKFKEAQSAFEGFLRDYPNSSLAPSAQFWLGNALYAQRDCKKAINAHNAVVTQYPDSSKAPDAMLAIATCQQELNDAKAARKTLETLAGKYPNTPAGETAKNTLKKKK